VHKARKFITFRAYGEKKFLVRNPQILKVEDKGAMGLVITAKKVLIYVN